MHSITTMLIRWQAIFYAPGNEFFDRFMLCCRRTMMLKHGNLGFWKLDDTDFHNSIAPRNEQQRRLTPIKRPCGYLLTRLADLPCSATGREPYCLPGTGRALRGLRKSRPAMALR